MSIDKKKVLADQIAEWTKERDRLNDLIAFAGGKSGQPYNCAAAWAYKCNNWNMPHGLPHGEVLKRIFEAGFAAGVKYHD